MAKRRMFSLDVVDTDKFLEMPASSQSLYFHLGMRADDDGFVSSPKKITNMVNCSNDDLKLLLAKGFLIPFESGIVVITDWKVNNYIRGDRYSESQYKDEKKFLDTTNNGKYTMKNNMDTIGIPNDNQNVSKMDTQVRLGKDSIDKNKKEKKENGLNEIINSYTVNENLKEAIRDFLKMRKAIKRPATDKALTLILNKLDKLSNCENEKIEILNQSIVNSWQGVFELKDKKGSEKQSKKEAQPKLLGWDD